MSLVTRSPGGFWGAIARMACACALAWAGGCAAFAPSNERGWIADHALLAKADFRRDQVEVHNIRNCQYSSDEDYVLRYYDKTFNLNQIRSVDFIIVPFADLPQIAHVMLSFGFANDEYVCVSVEIRREKGEEYSPIAGFLRKYELMYVVGDELDLIQLRTIHRLDDVYVYRTRATAEQARRLFVDMLNRANKLNREPEFYNTLTNNCTTNVVNHINKLWPNRLAYNVQLVLPGYSDRMAYELGLLDTNKSFEETRAAARVNRLAYVHRNSPRFSAMIREPILALRDETATKLR
ncbi:MAG: DUF4105 domain-containing protein [Pirellulales bacterium]